MEVGVHNCSCLNPSIAFKKSLFGIDRQAPAPEVCIIWDYQKPYEAPTCWNFGLKGSLCCESLTEAQHWPDCVIAPPQFRSAATS